MPDVQLLGASRSAKFIWMFRIKILVMHNAKQDQVLTKFVGPDGVVALEPVGEGNRRKSWAGKLKAGVASSSRKISAKARSNAYRRTNC